MNTEQTHSNFSKAAVQPEKSLDRGKDPLPWLIQNLRERAESKLEETCRSAEAPSKAS